ncbi:hypothetical protein TrST_g7146 [Triparma strigata]|uniref:ABC transporter domain-containing protein n=1 Tax=Triparma strigata TaxID=1606541 RepID=A0A9W7B482_9STRA|nr:hypothetical protein TrST_g7146 [Triparma strigata]
MRSPMRSLNLLSCVIIIVLIAENVYPLSTSSSPNSISPADLSSSSSSSTSSTPPVLLGTGLSHSYDGKVSQFSEVDITIRRGERIALVGNNGEGKSTLLKALLADGKATQGVKGKLESPRNTRICIVEQSPPDWGNANSKNSPSDKAAPLTVAEALFYSVEPLQTPTMAACQNYKRRLYDCEKDPNDAGCIDQLVKAQEEMEKFAPLSWDTLNEGEVVAGQLKLTKLLDKSLSTLSGGERKRAALAAGLLSSPDLLILDEPTNHLDLDGIKYLTEAILNTRSRSMALLTVTHDRAFLDKVCDTVLELDKARLFSYRIPQNYRSNDESSGSFGYYMSQKAERLEKEEKEESDMKNKLKKELEWMRRQPQARETKQRARQNDFYDLRENLQLKSNTLKGSKANSIELEQKQGRRLGNDILKCEKLCLKSKDADKVILNDFSYSFENGDRIAIVGDNGVGKTTFINLLIGEIAPDSGKVVQGETVTVGYYDQKGLKLDQGDEEITCLEFVKKNVESSGDSPDVAAPLAETDQLEAMRLLKKFNFPRQRWQTRVKLLSGGEKRRLQLLQVISRRPNFLCLDEPSNDLDIATLESLESYLQEFKGVVVIVSHDEYFLSKTVDHLFVFEGDGIVKNYMGTMAEYLALREEQAEEVKDAPPSNIPAAAAATPTLSKEDTRKVINLQRDQKKIMEQKIPNLQKKLETAENELTTQSNEGAGWTELGETQTKIDDLKTKIEDMENEWMEIEMALEDLK